jgi:hypothetical protein
LRIESLFVADNKRKQRRLCSAASFSARRHIEVAAQMLAQRANDGHAEDTEDTRKLYEQLRRDIWDHGDFQPKRDQVGHLLTEFVAETIAFAEPVIA